MSLEDDLKVLLRERAAEPAPQAELLESVRAGVRRDGRRRALLAGGSAAVALVVAVAAPVVLADREKRAAPVTPATSAPQGDWVHPRWPARAFPMRPGWVPGGLGEPRVITMGPNVLLHYERGSAGLEAEIGPLEPSWEAEGEKDRATEVNGRPGTLRTGDSYDGSGPGERYVGVRWRLADQRWAQVLSFGRATEAEVLRFARELRAGSVPAAPSSITFEAIPAGLHLQHESGEFICLARPPEVAANRQPSGLCVSYAEAPPDEDMDPGTEKVSVGGRPADYAEDAAFLGVDLGGGRRLEMTWDPAEIPLSREEAIRLLEGVTIR